MLSVSQQSPQRGGTKPSACDWSRLREPELREFLWHLYTGPGCIFVQSLSEHWGHGAVSKTWLHNGERLLKKPKPVLALLLMSGSQVL